MSAPVIAAEGAINWPGPLLSSVFMVQKSEKEPAYTPLFRDKNPVADKTIHSSNAWLLCDKVKLLGGGAIKKLYESY